MAQIQTANNTSMLRIEKFLGLNEGEYGATALKHGEAAVMQNFRVTKDYHLRNRPALLPFYPQSGQASAAGTQAMWCGYLNGKRRLFWVAGGTAYAYDGTQTVSLGEIDTPTAVFAFNDYLYLLRSGENPYYKRWDGGATDAGITEVEGYIPTILTTAQPSGAGTALEGINRLTGKRRVLYCGDGETKAYTLPESPVIEILSVLVDNVPAAYGWDLSDDGTITFSTAPAKGINNVEVIYRTSCDAEDCIYVQDVPAVGLSSWQIPSALRLESVVQIAAYQQGQWTQLTDGEDYHVYPDRIEFQPALTGGAIRITYRTDGYNNRLDGMKFAELYNGSSDTRVFLYGNGTNLAYYSGVTAQGVGSAEYFPALYEVAVGDSSSPITGMIRQYSHLMVFKPDSAWAILYDTVQTAEGDVIPGLYVRPMHKEVGNEAPGQVLLVNNRPYTICHRNLYEWKTSATYYRDERYASVLSQRVQKTMRQAEPETVYCFDDDMTHEYYVFLNDTQGTALVYNYELDVFYRYTGLRTRHMARFGTTLFFGGEDGVIYRLTDAAASDFGEGNTVSCLWESGDMSMGAEEKRKYSSVFWLSLLPDADGESEISFSARTDRKNTFSEKSVQAREETDYSPNVTRIKLKVKKYARCALKISCQDVQGQTVVLSLTGQVRYTGNVK